MNHKYIEVIHNRFNVSDKDKSLFKKISETPTERRGYILKDVEILAERADLAYALLALYRQQVNTGFVLADPLKPRGKEEKRFFDLNTGINFHLQWNPDWELRKNHELLIKRGVIAEYVDKVKLVNKDKNGKACYLCKENIDVQNPREILFKIELAGEKYYAGSNFAYIVNNHFTIMNAKHRPQKYRKKILEVSYDFIDKTNAYFRSIFNSLAGASIEEHEHLQATSEELPVEEIRGENKDVVYESNGIRISQPKYYIPLWIVEGTNKIIIEDAVDKIIIKWHGIDEQYHTENIISTRTDDKYRTFIILRDKRKLAGMGKKGPMATFEAGGKIILSYEPSVNSKNETNEREIFDRATLETVKLMLVGISPEKQLTEVEFKY